MFVTNADVGFLRPKMPAQVRVDATPSPNTAISQASSSALASSRLSPINKTEPVSRSSGVEASIPRKRGKRFPVSAGQSVSVNFIVRDKPVISLLTDSVEKAFDALRGIKPINPEP